MSKQEQDFLAIREAIISGTKEFLSVFNRDCAGERMFGLLLVVVWEGYDVEAVAGTEEGLVRAANLSGNLVGSNDDAAIQSECLKYRWSGYEDAWYDNFAGDLFHQANQLIAQAHESGLLEMGDQQLQQICLEALKELDSAGTFGIGAEREALVIGLSDVGGDHTEEDFLSWAEAVNPPIVIQRLQRELKEASELREAQLASMRKAREAAKPNNRSGAGWQN